MKVPMEKSMAVKMFKLTNCALIQVLRRAVTRLQVIQKHLVELEDAIDDEVEEMEQYTDDISDCFDRIADIDLLMKEILVDRIHEVKDVQGAVQELAEERQEEKNLIKVLTEARQRHVEAHTMLMIQFDTLKKERLELRKTRLAIFHIFKRNGMFELARRRLAARKAKAKHVL